MSERSFIPYIHIWDLGDWDGAQSNKKEASFG